MQSGDFVKKTKTAVFVLVPILILSACFAVFSVSEYKKTKDNPFTAPEFESEAVSGAPGVDIKSLSRIYKDGMGFSALVCGEIRAENGRADVYFTNEADNNVYLRLKITDSDSNVLAETGLIKPGEYVKSVSFDKSPYSGQTIKIKIMAYEPDTFYSAGAVTLNTTAV